MEKTDWQGVYPALTSKFKNNGELNYPAMAEHLEFQLDAGVHGLILLGSLGENPTLSAREKDALVKFFVQEVNGRVPVIAGVAECATRDALVRVAAADDAGIDGYMLLPPMRYPSDRRETLAYLCTVAQATDRPIMLYNNPVAYGTDLLPTDFAELASTENFVAIKESSANTRRMSAIRRHCGDRYALFCGVDDLALECFAVGAVGWVAGLVVAFPAETVRLYALMKAGDWAGARELYDWFLPLLELDIGPKFVQQIKLVEELAGVGSARVRPPRLALDEKETAHVEQVFAQAMASRPAL